MYMTNEHSLGERHSASFLGTFFYYLGRYVPKWIFI